MNFKGVIIAYLPHKRMGNTGNKKIIFFAIMKPLKKIIFFAIMKPLSGALKTPIKTQKRGLLSWKTKTLKQINRLH
nr:type I restriction endonuclease [Helicobacter pylori]